MKRHLDLDITMEMDGSYTIEISENETGEHVSFSYVPRSMIYGNGAENWYYLEDIHNEIISWLLIMEEERVANIKSGNCQN